MNRLHSHAGLRSVGRAMRLPLLCSALLALHSPQAAAALAGGTYTINPSGTASATVYNSLKDAISDMTAGTRSDGFAANGAGISGPVIFELAAGYTSSGESFPLTFQAITGASSTNTITVRPASGVSSVLSIAGSSSATVFLQGANYVIFDGRPGGTGTNKYLEISNSNTSGMALFLANSASNNVTKYCTLRGVGLYSLGTVYFGAAGTGNGNDNNTIDNCNIEMGASRPDNSIYSVGTASFDNSGNTISNCNISNFSISGITVGGANDTWTISGNSFYQTTPIVLTGAVTSYGISVEGNGHIISGNYIGGSQPQCGGSTAWSVTGAYANLFRGINLSGSSTTKSTVQSNRIANISFQSTSTTASGAFTGVLYTDLVDVLNNTIGSDTGNGSISFLFNGTSGFPRVMGIFKNGASYNVNVRDNIIGSITATSTIATQVRGVSIFCITATYGASTTNVVSGNRIGSATTANSINAAAPSNTGAQTVVGIYYAATGATPALTLADNIIANLTNSSVVFSNSSGSVTGIEAAATQTTITGNVIYSLKTLSAPFSYVRGIHVTGGNTTLPSVTLNTIYNLVGGEVRGMELNAASGTVNSNLVHSLALSSVSLAESISGITNNSAALTYTNNMVRIGIDADGNNVTKGNIVGINSNAATNNFYHNTVYVGGTGVTANSSAAFDCFDATSLTVNAQNNIFVNERSNGSGSGSHYAVRYFPLPSAGAINNNLLYVPGVGGKIAFGGTNDYTTLSNWQGAGSFDAASISEDPLFVNATGNAEKVDLHVWEGSPVEGKGASTSVTTDFDNETRSGLTPNDIGADAGNFKVIEWSGASSTNWGTGGNWVGNVAPTSTDNVLIPGGKTNYPSISTTINCSSLMIKKGGRLTMTWGTLNIAGNIINYDTINAQGGSITLAGTKKQKVAAGVLRVANLTLNNTNGATMLSGNIGVLSTYIPASGRFTTNDSLVFRSHSGGTGRISAGATSGNYISGKIIMERYIPGKRVFRFLAHPFASAIAMSELTDDIDVTGTGGAPFTTTQNNNPSAFSFDQANGDNSTTGVNPGWAPFTASSMWNRHQAMRILVRGAKGEGLNGNSYTPSATTVDLSGVPNQGNITIPLTKGANTNFVMVGNPFASEVNMDVVSATNVGSAFMVWNANQGTSGGYTSYSYGTSGFRLPSCGSFFTTLTANGSMLFEETDKSGSGGSAMFKGTATNHIVELSLEDSTIFWDRLLVHFDSSAMATVDYPDAVKLYNPDMTFYTLSKDDSMLAIDARPFTDKEVIKLGLYSTINKNFKITVPNYSTPAGTKVYLKDNYLNKTEEITGVGYTYWFATTADKKSWGNDRFELFTEVTPVGIVEAQPASNLKVKLAPNPASNEVNIYCEGINGKTATVTIMNMMGVQVAAGSTSTGHLNVPMQQIPAGMYTVTIQCGGQTITQKLIKK